MSDLVINLESVKLGEDQSAVMLTLKDSEGNFKSLVPNLTKVHEGAYFVFLKQPEVVTTPVVEAKIVEEVK